MRNEPKIRKHFLDLTEEQKERIFERDLASRQGEFRSKRQRRFIEAILTTKER